MVEAIRSRKFAYVAHPDIFMEKRDSVPESELEEYMQNARKAMEMICEASKECNIPLEINLGSISAIAAGIPGKTLTRDGTYPYPVPEFWKIAEEKGCKVLIGIDAHDPQALQDRTSERIARKILKDAGINLEFLESFELKGIGKEGIRSNLTFQKIGEGTRRDFTSNSEQASKVFETLEHGIRTQKEIKEGQTQGEE